jgi:RHS repeat-associated protein
MHKFFSKTFLCGLPRIGIKFANVLMLTSILVLNATGTVQAHASSRDLTETARMKNSVDASDFDEINTEEYVPPVFEHTEVRRVNNTAPEASNVSRIENTITPAIIQKDNNGDTALKVASTYVVQARAESKDVSGPELMNAELFNIPQPSYSQAINNYALRFKPSVVSYPSSASLNFGGDMTIEFWIKTTSFGGSSAWWYSSDWILNKDLTNQGRPDWSVVINLGRIVFINGNPGGGDQTLYSNSSINDGVWHHIAISRYATTSGLTVIYVDGIENASGIFSTASLSNGQPLYIGSFSGDMDDLRLWNIPRSQSEIQSDMFALANGDETGLVGYWPFNEGSGSVVEDITQNYVSGQIRGDGDPEWILAPELYPSLSLSTSTIAVSPDTPIVDESNTATVTVTLKSNDGIPVPNRTVEIALDSGSGLTINNQDVDIDQYVAIGITNSSGMVTGKLKTTVAGIRTLKARSGQEQITQQGAVNFIAGPASPEKSTVTTDLTAVTNDGIASATITVTALDAYNNPVEGVATTIAANGDAAVTQLDLTTNAQGKITASVRDVTSEVVTVTAVINNTQIPQTVDVRFHCGTSGDLVIVSGDACSFNAGTYTFNSVVLENNGTLILWGDPTTNEGVTINTANMTINAGGKVTSDGQGYTRGTGPGAGTSTTGATWSVGGGAGHGGQGGASSWSYAGGMAKGNIYEPVTLGSGGGNGGEYLRAAGGSGGGAIRLVVSDTLTVNGTVTANGTNGGMYYGGGGGGAGGSIWITTGGLAGSGTIQANGGSGVYDQGHIGGGGAGGRIAIDVPNVSNSFSGAVTTYGGWGNQYGGAGSVYWKTIDRLVVNNNGAGGAITPLATGDHHFDHIDIKGKGILRVVGSSSSLTVENGVLDGGDGTGRLEVEGVLNAPANFVISGTTIAVLKEMVGPTNITTQTGGGLELRADLPAYPNGVYSFQNITVKANTTLLLISYDGIQDDYGVTLRADNLTVEANGAITSDGQGYTRGTGPGAGTSTTGATWSVGGGAGHGGQGGASSWSYAGGIANGNLYEPVTLGSGGGLGGASLRAVGGAGGGAIRLVVNDTLTINGMITANGNNCGSMYYGGGGGGAGGSIWVTAAIIRGNGKLQANGGSGLYDQGNISGGGAGGRIAVYANSLAPTVQLAALGGWGYHNGEDGTIYLDSLDPTLSTLTTSPSSPVADGTNTATVTVTLRNKEGIPVPNRAVEIAISSGAGLSINNQNVEVGQYVTIGNTNSSGVVTALLTSTVVGERTLKARSGQEFILQQGTVNFVPGSVSSAMSLVISNITSAPADGQTPIMVTVTAFDEKDNPIPDAKVILLSTGNAVIKQPTVLTDNHGKASGQIVNSSSETVTVSATVNGVLLDDTVDLTFSNGDLSLTMTAPESAVANSNVNYTITIRRSNEMPAENVTLQLQLPADVTYISQNSGVTLTQSGQTLTWNLGTFTPGQLLTFDVNGHIAESATIGENLNVQSNVTSSTPETTLTNNTATSQTTIIDAHDFKTSISPTSHTVSIGASTLYEITIQNTGQVEDQYAISINDLNPQWYTLPQTSVNLLPGEAIVLPLTVLTETCTAAGTVTFNVAVTSTAGQQIKTFSPSVTFESGPRVSGLVPEDGSTIGSRNVTINWQTDTPSIGALKIFPVGHEEKTKTITLTTKDTTHSIVVPDLDRNITYDWYVDATSACGTTSLPHRNLTIGNGIVFVNRSDNFTVNHDYNQLVDVINNRSITVTVRNDDDTNPHTLTASVLNPYQDKDDILINFVDSGSIGQTITIPPLTTREVALAIHAQDAKNDTYDLTASLVADEGIEGGTPIHDNMTLHITILKEGDYSITEDLAASNEATLARTFVITNYGKPITDLSLNAVIPGTTSPAKIFLQPSLDHARLETGQSIRVTAYPLFSAEDAAAQANAGNTSQVASSLSENGPVNISLRTAPLPAVAPINYELQALGAGVTKVATGSAACGGSKSIMPVVMQGCTMTFSTSDWYCTNRPTISTPIQTPAFINSSNIASATLSMVFNPQPNVQPHSGQIYFNGGSTPIRRYGYPDTLVIPMGQFSMDIPVSAWNNSLVGNAVQSVQMSTQHPNPGHYVAATNYKLDVAIRQAITFVCADSQPSAENIVQQTYACKSVHAFNWLTDIPLISVLNGAWNKTATTIKGTIQTDSDLSTLACTQKACGDPINTKTGSSSFAMVDLSIPTSAGDLVFQRNYSSASIDTYNQTLGYGWTDNFASKLIFPDEPGGMQDFVLFQSELGNRYLFKIEANGTYTPGPGILADLTKTTSAYTIKSSQRRIFTFDLTGKLISREDAQGHAFDYEYDAQGRLLKVSADGGIRYIQIGYDIQGRIVTVKDHTGRQVVYGYNGAGDLVAMTDLLNQNWVYTYDSSHRLTEVLDPTGKQTVRTEYDMQGRAYRQFGGDGNLLVMVVYNSDGSATIYDALNHTEEHQYDEHGVAVSSTNQLNQTETSTFDGNFRPLEISNAAGHALKMTWSADGVNLLSKTDPAGNRTVNTYDALNNLTSVTDPLGKETTYVYNGKLLASSTDAFHRTTSYTYTPQGYLASVTDTANRTTSYTYDTFGQRISMTDPSGTWTYTYDALGRITDTTDPRGRISHTEYNAAGQILRSVQNYAPTHSQNDQNVYNIVTEYQYDTHGNQTSVKDTYGHITQYEYDNADRLMRTIDADGKIITNTYDAAGRLLSTKNALGQITSYTYDASGRLLSTTNPLGISSGGTAFNVSNNTSVVTNVTGQSTTFYYDKLGRVEKVVDALGNSTLTAYDANGNVHTRADQLNRVTTYEYDALNRLIRTIDPLGGVTETTYDSSGNRIATKDALGKITNYTYDAAGRLVKTTDPLGRETTTTYDQYGRRSASTDMAEHATSYAYDLLDRVISTTDPMGNTTYTAYDALGNVLARTDANGHVTSTSYDVLNHPATSTDANGNVTTNTYDAGGNLISVADSLGHTTTYSYDALNRQVAVTDPMGKTTRTVYDSLGRASDKLDQNGIATHFEYDRIGRQVAVIINYKPAAQANADTNVRYEYVYNAVGNRTSVKDAMGNITTYEYDALNRVTKKTDPLGKTWEYTYDVGGRMISSTDAKGQVIQYTYDAVGQLTHIDYPGSEADVSFTYNLMGQRIGMTDGLGATTWTYDNLNRVIAETDPNGKTVSYGYDAMGNRTGLTYPDGSVVSYAFDPANQLTGVNGPSASVSYTYDAANRLTGISRNNGVNTTYSRDDAGHITGLTHSNAEGLLASYTYTYDAAGNVTRAAENAIIVPPTITPTFTPTFTSTSTNTPTNTPTSTPTSTLTPTFTPTNTITSTPTNTPTTTAAPTVYTLVLQPNGANGVDTYILKSDSTANYGTSADLGIGEKNNATDSVARSLIKFDLSSLPADATVVSATLSLWTSQDLSDNDTTVNVYRLKKSFNESQANWNRSASGANWQTAGASGVNDRESTSIGSVAILNNESLNTEKQISLDPSKVQEMINGTLANNGFLLAASGELNDRFMFKSSDTSTASQRPKLVIQYTTASITPTATITPSATITPTPTKTATPTASNTSTPSSTPTAAPAGYLFTDGFESGNLSAWSSNDNDNGDLSVSTQAAAIGSYGLSALLNDAASMQVSDYSPNAEKHYSARFYLNPNSINLPNNHEVYIFAATQDSTGWVACLRLTRSGEYYILATCAKDDAHAWKDGKGVYITNAWQAVELEWQASSAPGANNGYVKLWVNDVLVDTISNIDSDTQILDYVSLGAVSGAPSGLSGTMYFDGFASNTGVHIGLDPNGPTVSVPLTDLIFADNFESNDFSLWSHTTTDGGDLSVSSSAALSGSYGMQAVINDLTEITATDYSPTNEGLYRARFQFDPNSIIIPSGNGFSIMETGTANGNGYRLMLSEDSGGYKLQAQTMSDAGTWIAGSMVNIPDAPQVIEVEYKAASAAGADDGYLKLWLNDTLVDTIANVDNDTLLIDNVSLGATGSLDAGTSGTVYFDAFESRRSAHSAAASQAPTTSVLTPSQAVTAISDQVTGYIASGDISSNLQNSLTNKLDNASTKLESGEVNPAVNQLEAFINVIQAQRGKKIKDDAADVLIAQANAVIALLSPTPTATATETPVPTQLGAVIRHRGGALFNFLPDPLETAVPTATPTDIFTPVPPSSAGALTIDYTYDALNRLTSAVYSDGRHFNYTYDANGNTLQLQRNLGPGTITTTYAYDAANQLNTATEGSNTWQLTYDANGSLISNGVSTYTYDSANRLIAVDGTDIDTTMSYNGLGQRLSMTASNVTTQYVMDGNNPLTADAGGNVTTYLYGLGAVAQKNIAWNYALPDGSNAPRQLTDANGEVALAVRYTPWGDTLETYGTGNFQLGYFGGVMDGATGLLYVGNGQYYDPATGRFLTRDAKPNQSNPYTPFDPMGALFAPLGVVALVYGGKRKGGRWAVLLVILSFVVVTGLTLSACGPNPTPIPPSPTPIPPSPTPLPTPIPSPNPSPEPSPTPAPTEVPNYVCDAANVLIPTPMPWPNIEWLDKGEHWKDYGHSGEWLITHYTYALERDPAYASGSVADKFTVAGLDSNKTYRRGFIWGDRGITKQGTGLSENCEYISIDYNKTDIYHDNIIDYIFKYVDAGRGPTGIATIAWQTVASEDSSLHPGDRIVIEKYPGLIFTVTDGGTGLGTQQLDVFVGEMTLSEADSLPLNHKFTRVGKVN